jgi:hypothetical protein
MANANISGVVLTDTFNTWVLRSNSVIDTVNQLRNSYFFKDGGTFESNGDFIVTSAGITTLKKTGGTGLIVQGSAQVQENLSVGSVSNVASSIANSRNTVTVYANSGSVRIANSINFVNTATINVSVAAGSTGNADVSFTVIGSVGGGAQGVQGAQGTQGRQGATGSQGVQGLQGLQGLGSQGVQGLQGSGSQGVQGLQGLQGLGSQGVQGLQGSGSQGVQGPTGGVSGTINSGTSPRLAYYSGSTALSDTPIALYSSTNTAIEVSGNVKFTGNIIDTPIVSVAASATYSDNAAGKIIVVDSSAADRVITFAAASTLGFAVTVIRKGASNVTISPGSGVTKLNVSAYTTSNLQYNYSSASVIYTATNEIILIGDIK